VTGDEVREARNIIGREMGLGRPLHLVELGRLLLLQGRDVGASVYEWEREHTLIRGPAVVAIQAMLDGWRPPGWESAITWNKRKRKQT
jgi:hypothetical protein